MLPEWISKSENTLFTRVYIKKTYLKVHCFTFVFPFLKVYVAMISWFCNIFVWLTKQIKCEGKVKLFFLFCLLLHMYSDCDVFIVYSYLLNCIVPLMSMNSTVTHTEDKSFTSELRFIEEKASVANPLFSYLHRNWLVRTECLFYAMRNLLFGALLFQIKLKSVLKEYACNPRMCVMFITQGFED